MEDIILRSVYLTPEEDQFIQKFADDLDVARITLIRTAISKKILEWQENTSLVAKDLAVYKKEGR